MKISIKKIEEVTGKKVIKHSKSIGLDIASRTGVCILEVNSSSVNFQYKFLEFDSNNEKGLFRSMVEAFEDLLEKQDMAIVEEPFVGFSRAGSMKLSTFFGFAIAECIKKNIPYDYMKAVSARAKFKIKTNKYGKGKSKLAVSDWLKTNLGIELDDHDVSDAIILALIGILK